MSPAQQPLLPGLGMQGAGVPTPPSTAGFQSQQTMRGERSESQSPMTADTDPSKKRKRDEGADAEMTGVSHQAQQGNEEQDVSMTEDSEHKRSDHERNEGEDAVPPLSSAARIGLHKLSTERKYHIHARPLCMAC